jgi:hypothetical protein
MNVLRKTAEQKVSASASKQVAKPRRGKDQHAIATLIQRRRDASRSTGPHPGRKNELTKPRRLYRFWQNEPKLLLSECSHEPSSRARPR